MAEDKAQTGAVGPELLAWAFRKFAAAFPQSFPDDEAARDKVALWREMLDSHPWVTAAVFKAGVYDIVWKAGEYLPPPATALDFFHEARERLRRETEKQLPPPEKAPPPDSPGQVSAKQAARDYLRARGFWKSNRAPLTEEEVAAAHERRTRQPGVASVAKARLDEELGR